MIKIKREFNATPTSEIIANLNLKLVTTFNYHFLGDFVEKLKNSYFSKNIYYIEWNYSIINFAVDSKPIIKTIEDLIFGFIYIVDIEFNESFSLETVCNHKSLADLIGNNKKLLVPNLVRCEAHRDILLGSIANNK